MAGLVVALLFALTKAKRLERRLVERRQCSAGPKQPRMKSQMEGRALGSSQETGFLLRVKQLAVTNAFDRGH